VSNRGGEELNTVDGDEGVAVSHQYSDNDAQNQNCYFLKPIMIFKRNNEVEAKMDDGRYDQKTFDDE